MRHVDQVAILIKHNAVPVDVASREGVGHIGGISGNEGNGRSSPASPWTRGPRRQQPKAYANCQGDHIQGEHEGDRLRGKFDSRERTYIGKRDADAKKKDWRVEVTNSGSMEVHLLKEKANLLSWSCSK
jgi:hypothetical protein